MIFFGSHNVWNAIELLKQVCIVDIFPFDFLYED